MVVPELVDGGKTVRGVIGDVTPEVEIIDQVPCQVAIVFDDQNAVCHEEEAPLVRLGKPGQG
jgi:hypothetical protein